MLRYATAAATFQTVRPSSVSSLRVALSQSAVGDSLLFWRSKSSVSQTASPVLSSAPSVKEGAAGKKDVPTDAAIGSPNTTLPDSAAAHRPRPPPPVRSMSGRGGRGGRGQGGRGGREQGRSFPPPSRGHSGRGETTHPPGRRQPQQHQRQYPSDRSNVPPPNDRNRPSFPAPERETDFTDFFSRRSATTSGREWNKPSNRTPSQSQSQPQFTTEPSPTMGRTTNSRPPSFSSNNDRSSSKPSNIYPSLSSPNNVSRPSFASSDNMRNNGKQKQSSSNFTKEQQMSPPRYSSSNFFRSSSASSDINNNQKHSTYSSKNTKENMLDISALRNVFLKSIAVDRARRTEKNPSTPPSIRQPSNLNTIKSNWRRGGAKEYRQQREQRQQQEKGGSFGRTNDHQKRRNSFQNNFRGRQRQDPNVVGAFFGNFDVDQETKKERQKQARVIDDNRVALDFDGPISVSLFADTLRTAKKTVIKTLKSLGEWKADKDEYLVDIDIMELVALELGKEPVRNKRHGRKLNLSVEDDKNLLLQRRAGTEDVFSEGEGEAVENAYESFPTRPPVVCLMGHVDHGKTTLMDALRRKNQPDQNKAKGKKSKKTKKGKAKPSSGGDVAGTEAGGITQVISAFQVALENQDGAVSFLDTPGHAAFRSMRESGSHAADVIVLVVAADDGVSQQTIEILNFYKSIVKDAGGNAISLVVAMTKIDKPGIDIAESQQRIEYQLLEQGITTENMATGEDSEYGPPVQLVPVSGITGDGIDELIESLVLQSEIMDLRADEEARGEGIVMDARVEKGLGVVADCIVRWGSMSRGDVVVSGVHGGKIKILKDVDGKTITTGLPSQPVRLLGFESLPKAGDPVICVASEDMAEKLIKRRISLLTSDSSPREDSTANAEFQVTGTASKNARMTIMAETKYEIDDTEGSQIRIPVIIKADADGTLAAVQQSLMEVGESSTLDLVVDPVATGIGAVLTSDVALAKQSGATIFCFGLKSLNDKNTLSLADNEGVPVHNHDIIYSLLDEAKEIFAKYLPASPVDIIHGKATVQAIFEINNKKDAERIAGLTVSEGTLHKDKADGTVCHYRVIRKGKRISPEGEMVRASSLKYFKEETDSVRKGDECGLALSGYDSFEKGDTIECYSSEMKHTFI